jgi:hypothetical protein
MNKVLRNGVLLGIGLLTLAVIACSSEASPSASDSAVTNVEEESANYDGPILRDSLKNRTILRTVAKHRELTEATVEQNAGEISIQLRIECAASEEKAKNTARYLAEELLRSIKRSGPDKDPTLSEVGTGDFDYTVGVACTDGNSMAKGLKVSGSAEIVWQ